MLWIAVRHAITQIKNLERKTVEYWGRKIKNSEKIIKNNKVQMTTILDVKKYESWKLTWIRLVDGVRQQWQPSPAAQEKYGYEQILYFNMDWDYHVNVVECWKLCVPAERSRKNECTVYSQIQLWLGGSDVIVQTVQGWIHLYQNMGKYSSQKPKMVVVYFAKRVLFSPPSVSSRIWNDHALTLVWSRRVEVFSGRSVIGSKMAGGPAKNSFSNFF